MKCSMAFAYFTRAAGENPGGDNVRRVLLRKPRSFQPRRPGAVHRVRFERKPEVNVDLIVGEEQPLTSTGRPMPYRRMALGYIGPRPGASIVSMKFAMTMDACSDANPTW
jgi:hypothetical protein